jgi:hypothetical protein
VFWHFHPNCNVKIDDNVIQSTDPGEGNLKIIPHVLQGGPARISLHKGEIEPKIQGWYSKEYNLKVPSNCASFNTKFNESLVILWLLIPGVDTFPDFEIVDIKYDQKILSFNLQKYTSVLCEGTISLENSQCNYIFH